MQSQSTEQLVKEHTDIIHRLDRAGSLQSEVSYVKIPYNSFEQDVFFERRDSGKRRLTNGRGNVFPHDRIKIERTMLITSDRSESGKKTIKVDTRSDRPNLVFFTDCGEQVDQQTQQIIGELAFRLWHKSQQRDISMSEINDLLRKLSAVAIHHTNQSSQSDLSKLMMFTDIEQGRYFAPFAYIQGQPSKQGLLDMKFVFDAQDLPDHVQSIKVEDLVGLRRGVKPYMNKALSDIKRAINSAQTDKDGYNLAASLMEQNLKTSPRQAVDLYDIVMNKKDDRELIEDLANNMLFQSAGGDSSVTMSTDDKQRVLKKDFIEALINRC